MTLPCSASDGLVTRQEKWVVYCVVLAAFTFQFEAFLVSVALPDMARELSSSSTEISFVVIAYLLAATISFLPAGRLGERYGLRCVFLYGAMLACAGTIFSGCSFNLPMLWVSRFIQGIGMGALVAVSYAMIPAWVNQKRLGWGYGMLSFGAGMGMIAGLPVGGLLAHYLVWQWIFLATIPIFFVLLVVAYRHLPSHKASHTVTAQRSDLDWVGVLLSAVLVSALMLTISLATEFGWTSYLILSLMFGTLVSAFALRWRVRTGRSLLSGSLLRCEGFLLALLTLFLFQFVSSGLRFLMPFYLELSFGLSVLMSSAFMLIYPLSFAPTAIWSGRLADRISARRMVLFSLGFGALSCALYVSSLEALNIWIFCLFIFCFGVVCALFSPPNNRLIMSSVSDQNRGEASALLPVSLNMGSLLGISFFETIFSQSFSKATDQALEKLIPNQVSQQVIIDGFKQALLLASLIFFMTFVVVLVASRPRKKYIQHK